tara:strand:- start:1301 stop:2293 length:993 start_codon:yes stop_codon:yes gene_type:complete
MKIIKLLLLIYLLLASSVSFANNIEFQSWKKDFKIYALKKGISQKTLDIILKDANYLPKVIKYDRFQPEFYEDTITYINKRTSNKKLQKGIILFNKNKKVINQIDKEFNVDKELLIALMGIETNYGKYLGKMDIISSLATLSYDKRRSEFFTNELITILKLIDKKIVDPKILYGSWAGAFGNFQFMPTTIEKYAVDYDKNNKIELKSFKDSFASAANYMNLIGWKKSSPCFISVDLKENIPKKFLNTSAKKISNKKKIKYFKKYIKNNININENLYSAIVTPDKDIIENSSNFSPAYLVFDNYELILKWNRSLRFALAVCTLKDKLKNEL